VDDTVSTQDLHQPAGCSSEWRSGPSGKLGDAISSQTLQETICCISVPSRKLHNTHLCCSWQETFFCTAKSYYFSRLNLSKDAVKLLERCSYVLLCWRIVDFFITEVFHKSHNKKNRTIFILAARLGTRTMAGPSIYRVSQEERTKLRESVRYVKL